MAIEKLNYTFNNRGNHQEGDRYIDKDTMQNICNKIDELITKINSNFMVGSVYITVVNTNPGTIFGGTWVLFGEGKTLVGVNTSDADFNTVLKTGGHKKMQKHNHLGNIYFSGDDNWIGKITAYPRAVLGLSSPLARPGGAKIAAGANSYSTGVSDSQPYNKVIALHTTESENAGEGNAENLQPYITVYFWRRTA